VVKEKPEEGRLGRNQERKVSEKRRLTEDGRNC